MDDSEDPLGKISRQLSELASAPSSPVSSNGSEWTQFSGISSQHNQNAGGFRNLYTWSSLNVHDYEHLQEFHQVGATAPEQNLSNHASNSYHTPLSQAHTSYAAPASYEWNTSRAPHKFSVSGDLGGRFVDTDQSRTASANRNTDLQRRAYLGTRSNSHQASSVFQGDDLVGPSNLNRRVNESHHTFAGSGSALERSLNDINSQTNIESYPSHHLSDLFLSEDNNSKSTDRILPMPQGSASMSHLQASKIKFDPSTPPPPLFSVRGSGSDTSLFTDRCIHPNQSPKLSEFSPLQSMSAGINIDLGTNIEPGNRMNSNAKQDISEEGKEIYEAAMKQWNSSPGQNNSSGNSKFSSSEQAKKLPASESSKPSYSDIAKTPKSGCGTKSGKANHPLVFDFDFKGDAKESCKKAGGSKKDLKGLHNQVKRTSSGSKSWLRNSMSSDSEHSFASSSAYNSLDNFDDPVLSPGSSSENLVHAGKIRRSSGSSVGSSVGAVEDSSFGAASAGVEQQHKKQNHTVKGSVKNQSSKSSSDSLFFDPRRIFQTKNTNKSRITTGSQKSRSASSSATDSPQYSQSDTVLNNGKPACTSSSSKLSTAAHQHEYINNDLRDSSKLTNQTAAETSQSNHRREDLRGGTGKKAGFRHTSRRDRRRHPEGHRNTPGEETAAERNRFAFLTDHIDLEKIEEWCSVALEQGKVWGNVLLNSMTNLIIYLLGVILYLASGGVQLTLFLGLKAWLWLRHSLLRGWTGPGAQDWRSRGEAPRRRMGLEENILLPNTGEDAMKRLLACKGKDPYSILGLRADSSDEDIKRYYRKQAVLVHPDKNQEPGAEEAFKVLGHAFEMIGDPSKRKKYDSNNQESNEADAMRKFADMLSELQSKLQEAANTMHCDNCGGKHRRVPVDRPFYSARFCQRCNVHHSAKEGDVWAESKMLGFYWHYYALMEGHVFDITEWMKCHKEFFQHMKANTHGVSYRIATDGNKKNRHHNQAGHGDANLEDIINRLFNKVSQAAGDGGPGSWGGGNPGDSGGWNSQSATAPPGTQANTNAKKNSRRRKKR